MNPLFDPNSNKTKNHSWRVCVAPMMDWTDRHCRYFHRLITQKTLLYTEMVTTGALLHGNVSRHLQFNPEEQPLALQLGGSEPADLGACARLGETWGYKEINLNCGCPSERVQKGAFGACLMNESNLVADCVRAMRDSVQKETHITVKHRIGIDKIESYDFVRDFVGKISEAGCETFIVHARNAWLKGLSPKENREIPPLRYDVVYRLKKDFPDLIIVINGGIQTNDQIKMHLDYVDGVMIGREAYHHPWIMSEWDDLFHRQNHIENSIENNIEIKPNKISREEIEEKMVDYILREQSENKITWNYIARHFLGLRNGLKGAKHWRQVWSDHHLRDLSPKEVMLLARKPKLF